MKGFCPSFVTVRGGMPRKLQGSATRKAPPEPGSIPEPELRVLDQPFNILITGIGGTGVITVGSLLGMAAHLESRGASVLDMTGMSQKNGAVTSHVRIAATPSALRAQRIATGEADLVLACDMLTAGSADAVSKMRPGRTLAVVNSHQQPAGPFARDPDWEFPAESLNVLIAEATGGRAEFLDATSLATLILGDSIAANLFLLGYAFQRGAVPVSLAAMLRAIEINGVAVAANKRAFHWGRMAAVDLPAVARRAAPEQVVSLKRPQSLRELLDRRVEFLTDYQDARYATRYRDFVDTVRNVEEQAGLRDRLSKAVAQNLFKLMAYKDEYEVARLHVSPVFRRQLEAQFEGKLRLSYHLAPPALAGEEPLGKRRFGSWMKVGFHVLARMKALRGTAMDPFGRTGERRMERALVDEYRALVEQELRALDGATLARALEIARVPEKIRGFGPVKEASIATARAEWRRLQADAIEPNLPALRQAA